MQIALRRFSLPIGIIFAALGSTACRGDVTAADESDALARDSTLSLQVLLASGDSLEIGKAEFSEHLFADVLSGTSSAPIVTRAPARVAATTAVVPTIDHRAVVWATAPKPAAKQAEQKRTPPVERAVAAAIEATPRVRPVESSATVPAGTEIVLEASRRICVNTSSVGDRFSGRLARSLAGPDGTVIPRGASVTGVVTSLVGPLGEEQLDVDVRSVTVGARTYTVNSRVTDIELDRTPGAYRCIPDEGRIVAQLTQALRTRIDSR